MILKGSQRSGASNLSAHLMNDRDNDHVTLFELRGFVARDLHGALAEAHAISKGTKCEQFMFSLSLSPPKDAYATEQDLVDAVDRAEEALGLDGQPRAIIFHEKCGRRHAHAVWSRIDANTMTAINMAHFKNKLVALSRQLYLDHEWSMPDGLRPDGGKSSLNFSLEEWRQAKRVKLDPREIKQSFMDAWAQSDGIKAFENALENRGYYLARGDRRGFVAINVQGEVFSVARMIGMKAKELSAKLGDPDMLRSVDGTQSMIASKISDQLQSFINDVNEKHERDFEPFEQQRQAMVQTHRLERERLRASQKQRWDTETANRAARLNTGFRGLWDVVRGHAAKIKTQNEMEAWDTSKRDQMQRDDLVMDQMLDRKALQNEIDALRRMHSQDRKILAREVTQAMNAHEQTQEQQKIEQEQNRNPKTEFGFRL